MLSEMMWRADKKKPGLTLFRANPGRAGFRDSVQPLHPRGAGDVHRGLREGACGSLLPICGRSAWVLLDRATHTSGPRISEARSIAHDRGAQQGLRTKSRRGSMEAWTCALTRRDRPGASARRRRIGQPSSRSGHEKEAGTRPARTASLAAACRRGTWDRPRARSCGRRRIRGGIYPAPRSDRAFRALARSEPDIMARLVAAVAPGLLARGAALSPDDVAPTHIDGLPPELDADFAARVDAEDLLHLECQGYRDAGFEPRTLWYHLGFALRHRGKRRVRTLAIWLTTPPGGKARNEIIVHDIKVTVTAVVLHEVKASVLLADPRTACFAAGAHKEGRSTEEPLARPGHLRRERRRRAPLSITSPPATPARGRAPGGSWGSPPGPPGRSPVRVCRGPRGPGGPG